MKNRLLWVLLAVIAFDFTVTLLGQPSSYWRDPHTAREGNQLFAWFMVRGLSWYVPCIVGYIAGVVYLVKSLPRRAGFITGLAFVLAHYFAGCTWLLLRFDFGMTGPVVYAIALSIALVSAMQSAVPASCVDKPA